MRMRQLGPSLLAILLIATTRALAADPTPDKPTPPFGVPADDALAAATALVKRTYAQDYAAATTLPLRTLLAQRLLKEALDTKDDTPARYILLCESRDLAARAADAPTACRAIDTLAKFYGVSPGEMTVAALSAAARVALTPQSHESLVRSALAAADAALARDDYTVATRLAAVAESVAAKAQRLVLLTDAQDKVKEITWAANEYAQAKAALETLATRPNDAAARSTAGRFKCLVKNDWDHGLPLLVDGSDAKLKLLAERDQAALTAPSDIQKKIGDDWWTFGEQYLARARLACRTRAAYWYQRAVPKLAGISLTTVQQRLDEFDQARLRDQNLQPGLAAEIFADKQFTKPWHKQVDPRLDFDWPKPRTTVPKDDFSVRWTGYLRAPAAGKYTLGLLVNDGARVYLDDQLALEEPKGTQKRKPTQATLTLTAGLHPLRIEFWDTGGLAKIHLYWRTPGSTADEVIPAKAFVHEVGTGQ
jgi:hypothetical protein